jgi:acyl-CoA synthetase (AMP-forming)/AMP-acid ligase II
LADLPAGTAHVKITSATSGAPKFVLFKGEQLVADADNIVSTMGLHPAMPNLGCISLAHSYGFSNLILPLLLHGIPLILVPTPLPEMVRRGAKSYRSITLAAVPALWKAWSGANAIPPNTGLGISAGAPLPIELEENVFKSCGVKIHNFYGSSECGGIAYDRTSAPRSDSSCAGSPMDNVSLSISQNDTLVVTSRAVGEGYWPGPKGKLQPGRFETGDLAEIREGQIYLRGRLGDTLNISGRKASPEAIESALRSHPEVVECVIFGIPDTNHDRTEIVVAAVNTRSHIAVAELASFLTEKIPAWQIPRHWWFTNELQTNSRGKISRSEWRRGFIEKRPLTETSRG